jgi:NAD(P)H-dependent FMN reductase
MKIAVIQGTTRPGRRSERVATWLMSALQKYDAEFELLDLKDYSLPFFEEEASPMSAHESFTNPMVQAWTKKVGEADAFIMVTGEYNFGPPAVLKNALDYVYKQWNRKPFLFVSYSGNAVAGVRAVQQLRINVIEVEAVPIQAALHIANVLDAIDEEGILHDDQYLGKLDHAMEQFLWWAHALKDARAKM